MPKRHPKGKGCWYYTTIYECQICGHTDIYRERRWGKKPENPALREDFNQTACSGHFL